MTDEENKQKSSLNMTLRIVGLITSGIGVVSAILYYVGRRYVDAYYDTLGVPYRLLGLGTPDYIYEGTQIGQILIVIALSAFTIGFLRLLFMPPKIEQTKKSREKALRRLLNVLKSKPKRVALFGFFYFIYYIVLWIAFGLMKVFGFLTEPAEAVAIVGMILLILAAGIGLLVMYDKTTLEFIYSGQLRKRVFIGLTISMIVFLPYFGANAWGTYKGVLDTQPGHIGLVFDSVELNAEKPINDN